MTGVPVIGPRILTDMMCVMLPVSVYGLFQVYSKQIFRLQDGIAHHFSLTRNSLSVSPRRYAVSCFSWNWTTGKLV